MATYTKITNLKGPQGVPGEKGETGTFASASAEQVGATDPAEAIIGGTPAAATVHFKIPRGLPGMDQAPADEAVAAYILDGGTDVRAALSRTAAHPRGVPVESFLQAGESLDRSGTNSVTSIVRRAVQNVDITRGQVQITFPEGRFYLDDNASVSPLRHGVGIRGAGKDRTVFVLGPNAKNAFGGYGDLPDDTILSGIVMSDFTIDCSQQYTASSYDSSRKGLVLGHVQYSRFENIKIMHSWGSAFGVDYLRDVVFFNCEATDSGRGLHKALVTGAGAGFGIGVGAYDDERAWFIDCKTYDNNKEGWNLEYLPGVSGYTTAKMFLIGCSSDGDTIGVGDHGTGGVHMTGCVIQNFSHAGVVIAHGGTAPMGGRNGVIDASNVIRQGRVAGPTYPDIYGAHGIVIRGSDAAGGYRIDAQIEDNDGAGIYFEPGFRLSPGGIKIGAQVRNNRGGGVIMYGGGQMEQGVVFEGGTYDNNSEVGLDLRSAFQGLTVRGNTFFGSPESSGGDSTLMRDSFGGAGEVNGRSPDVSVTGATWECDAGKFTVSGGKMRLVEGQSSPSLAASPTWVNESQVLSVEGKVTRGIVAATGTLIWVGVGVNQSNYLRIQTEGQSTTTAVLQAVVGGSVATLATFPNPPWTGTAELPFSIEIGEGGEVVASLGAQSVNATLTGSQLDAVVPTGGGSRFMVRVGEDMSGVFALDDVTITGLHTGGSSAQEVAVRFDPTFTLDSPTVEDNVAYSTTVLVAGETAATNPRIVNNRSLSGGADPKLIFFDNLTSLPEQTGLGAGWIAAPVVGRFTTAPVWKRQPYGAVPDTSGASNGGCGQYRDAGRVDSRVSAIYEVPTGGFSPRGIMHSFNPSTGHCLIFWADPVSGRYQVYKYASNTPGGAAVVHTTDVSNQFSHEMALEHDAGTTQYRAYIDGKIVWQGSVAGLTDTNYVGLIANATLNGQLFNFGIRQK